MNREEMMARVAGLPFAKEDFWLVTGGAMVLYGIREQTGDIDLGCSKKLSEELQAQGCPVQIMPDGTKRIEYAPDVELFEGWLYDKVADVDGLPVISREGLIAMKRQIGREKDLRDIDLIEKHMAERGR